MLISCDGRENMMHYTPRIALLNLLALLSFGWSGCVACGRSFTQNLSIPVCGRPASHRQIEKKEPPGKERSDAAVARRVSGRATHRFATELIAARTYAATAAPYRHMSERAWMRRKQNKCFPMQMIVLEGKLPLFFSAQKSR